LPELPEFFRDRFEIFRDRQRLRVFRREQFPILLPADHQTSREPKTRSAFSICPAPSNNRAAARISCIPRRSAADGEFEALPIQEDPIVLLTRVPAQYEARPRAADLIELDRRPSVALCVEKAVDGLEILRDCEIGKNTRAEPRPQQKG
jgi:hypothetical protein